MIQGALIGEEIFRQFVQKFEAILCVLTRIFGQTDGIIYRQAGLLVLISDSLNIECTLPNGKTGKILDENKKYYANQIDIAGSDKCYGVAADENMVAVYKYGCNAADAELIIWKKL